MSIYQELIQNKVQVYGHESDLYCPVTSATAAILANHPAERAIATVFKDEVTGRLSYDIPFAFEPFWNHKTTNQAN